MIPRSGRGTRAWTPDHFATTAITGFNETVQLGGPSHRVFQDDQIVMRAAFYDEATGRPLRPGGEFWLRGSVAVEYHNGKWRSTSWDEPAGSGPPKGAANLVRQELTIEPLDVNRLFCVHPVFRLPESDSRIGFRPSLARRTRVQRRGAVCAGDDRSWPPRAVSNRPKSEPARCGIGTGRLAEIAGLRKN